MDFANAWTSSGPDSPPASTATPCRYLSYRSLAVLGAAVPMRVAANGDGACVLACTPIVTFPKKVTPQSFGTGLTMLPMLLQNEQSWQQWDER